MSETRTMQTIDQSSKFSDLRWWNYPANEAHRIFLNWCDMIRNRPQSRERRRQHLLYYSMYSNYPLLGFGLNTYTRTSNRFYWAPNRITLNAGANAIDALHAKITKNRPRPTFTTVDGDYDLKERAELMQRFVDGQFQSCKYYDKRSGSILDACIAGTGSAKFYEAPDMTIGMDKVGAWENLIDDREVLYGEPRNRGQRKHYDRIVLQELYAKDDPSDSAEDTQRKDDIRRAMESTTRDVDPDDFDYDDTCEQVLVYEGWHLPSGPKAKDGKHIIAIRGATLLFEDWDEDTVPLIDIRPIMPPLGFWGIGLMEKVAGIQAEINRLIRDIQSAMHLIAKPHWMLENSSKVAAAHLDNDIATIIRYSGAVPPTVYTPQAMSNDVYQHLQFLYRTVYEITGISQLTAQSQIPAGLERASGIALNTFLNQETERFTAFVHADERLAQDASEQVLRLSRRIAKKKKNYKARAMVGGGYKEVAWSDVDLNDKYFIQVFPTSLLPQTPAGKLAFVQQMTDQQYLSADEALELLDWPDTEGMMKRRTAPRRLIEKNIAAMKRGEPVTPEPLDDHKTAMVLVNQAYHEARLENLPDDRLELMREYLVLSEKYLNPGPQPGPAAAAPPPPPGAPPPGAPPPPGPPMPPAGPPQGAPIQ